jgi:hypothetical protein
MERKGSTANGSAKASGSSAGSRAASGSGTVNMSVGELPDEHALEAGRLFVKISMIELSLESLIWGLAGLDEGTGSLITRNLDIRRKRKCVSELLLLKKAPPKALTAWASAEAAISKAIDHRNWIAHAVPMRFGVTTILMRTRNAKSGDILQSKLTTIDETKAAYSEADEAIKYLTSLIALL